MLLYIEYIDCQWRTYPTLTCTWSALPWPLAGRDPAPVLCITSSPTPACPSPCPSLTVTGGENTQTQVKQYSFISFFFYQILYVVYCCCCRYCHYSHKLFTFTFSSPLPLSLFKPNLVQNILSYR